MIWGRPIAIAVEPTTACNLRCPHCVSGLRAFLRPTGSMDLDLYQRIIDAVSKHAMYVTLYFQGEPFLHRAFTQMISYAVKKRMITVTSTNGHFLQKDVSQEIIRSGLHRLIVSVDGTTQSVYEQYRINGNLQRVVDGIHCLVEEKKRLSAKNPEVVIQFLVMATNEHQMNEMKRLAKEWQVDRLWFKTMQLHDPERNGEWLSSNPAWSRYRKENGGVSLRAKPENHCWRMWHSCVVTWDGHVVPCCFDKNAQYRMGNFSTSDFDAIWYGQPYQDFRMRILQNRSQTAMCTNCSEGSKVWIR